MKIKLFIFVLLVFNWSCSSDKSESTQSMDKSAGSIQASPTSTEYYAADSTTVFSNEEAESSEKSKKAEISVTDQKVSVNKQTTLKQNLANLSDTLYLKNVRLSKKFIKTADLQFKVKNVEKVTNTIETLTLKLDGYIQQSQIKSNYVSARDIEISQDTVMKVMEYFVDNHMIIRIPSLYFDSVLNELSKLHIYLDWRNVKTEDVSTIFLRNKLKGEKRTEYEKRIQKASVQGNRKLDDIVEAERTASDLADIAIDKKIENYELQDRIDFSTIVLSFYQANTIHKELVQNTTLSQYQQSFWQKAWNAIRTGWNVILDILIGLLYLWPLYILIFVVYYIVKVLRKRFNK